MLHMITYTIIFIFCSSHLGEAAETPEAEKIDFKKLRVELDEQLWWTQTWKSNSQSKSELVRKVGIVEDRYINMEKNCTTKDKEITKLHAQNENMLKAINCVERVNTLDSGWSGPIESAAFRKKITDCLDIYYKTVQTATNPSPINIQTTENSRTETKL